MQTASYSTRELARMTGASAQTIFNSHSRNGQWQGIKPTKNPFTGTLAWPTDEVNRLILSKSEVHNE